MEGLEQISIGSLAKGIRGVSYKPHQLKEDIGNSDFFLLRSNNIQDGRIDFNDRQIVVSDCVSEKQKLLEGDIIVCMSNGSRHLVGKSALVEKLDANYCVGAFCSSFRVNEGVDPNFVFQVFQSKDFKNKIDVILSGSAINNLQNKHIEELNFDLPSSEPEQTRIAQILSKADEAIAQTEALIAKYQRIKTGLMQDLLTRGIDEHGNIRSKATHRFLVKNGIEVPEEWDVDCLATLIKAVDAHPSHRTPPSVEIGVPYLGISDIDEYGNIDQKKCRKVSKSVLEEHNNRYLLRDGDIIFGKIGTIGEPKRLKAWKEVTISANVILIQPHDSPDFIFWVLSSEFINTQVKNTIHSTTQPAFGMEKIRALTVLIPPKDERERIGTILNKAEHNLISTKTRSLKLQSLKTGLMQDLLSGKVRVKIKEETLVIP